MDAIKFLADCIRAEKMAEAEKAAAIAAANNPTATVADTVGAIAPIKNESDQEQPKDEKADEPKEETQPETEEEKGDD